MQRHLLLAAAVLLLAGCASTSIRDSWSDPAWQGPAFRKVLVLGVSRDVTDRRVFEDVMSERIAATGAQAVQAYRFLRESGKVPEADLDRAVRESGADALLMSRVLLIDRRVNVSTTMVPTGPRGWGPGWYGWYSGWFPATDVYTTETAVVETTVFDAKTRNVVWTGTTETFQPRSVQQDAPGFAGVIVSALSQRGVLPPLPTR